VLVLSRRLNESIVLPASGITIQVVAIRAGQVRLGIKAPADVPVMREELLDQSPAPAPSSRNAERPLCPA
jgi:carbon storage regulator